MKAERDMEVRSMIVMEAELQVEVEVGVQMEAEVDLGAAFLKIKEEEEKLGEEELEKLVDKLAREEGDRRVFIFLTLALMKRLKIICVTIMDVLQIRDGSTMP